MKNTIVFLIAFFLLSPSIKASTINLVPPVKKITIYWDSSLSMKDKDIDKELALLDAYFNKTPNAVVDLITFSNSIDLQQRFDIINSNWNDLKEVLLKTKYDGVAFYDVLLQETTSNLNFLFTDGIEILDKLILNKTIPTYVINSSQKTNAMVLIKQSYYTKGKYLNLTKISIQEALAKLNNKGKEVVNTTIKKSIKENSTPKEVDNRNFVTGNVFSSKGALVKAAVTIKGKKQGVVTDVNGKFTIKATQGDVLIISYLSKKTKEVLIGNTRVFNVQLIGNKNELDEVVVKGKSKPIIEMVETAYGKVNKEKLGYAVKTINEKQLMSGEATTISDAVRGKMGANQHSDDSDLSLMVFRGWDGYFALIVIDGVPLRRNTKAGMDRINGNATNKLLDFIDPRNVASVTVLKGLAATNRFGSEGGSGVILITTKSSLAGKKNKNSQNTALAKDNDFTENLSSISTTINEKYIDELKEFKTLNEVYNHYLAVSHKLCKFKK